MSIQGKRAFLTFLKVFNAVGLVLLIALTFVVLSRISAQAKQTHDDTQASTTRIENDLNCLGRFFSQTNRTNLKISDLNTCTIVNTATGETNVLTGPPSGTTTSSSPQRQQPIAPSSTPQTNSTAPKDTTSEPPDPQTTVDKIINPITNALGGIL